MLKAHRFLGKTCLYYYASYKEGVARNWNKDVKQNHEFMIREKNHKFIMQVLDIYILLLLKRPTKTSMNQ